jgi:predicted metalloprotease
MPAKFSLVIRVAATLTSVVAAVACAVPTAGTAAPDPAVGLPITTGESGLKPGAPDAGIPVANTDQGAIDRLAVSAVADVQDFWEQRLPQDFQRDFAPVRQVTSYDSDGTPLTLCRSSTAGLINAFYCSGKDDLVAWDRGQLLPMLQDSFGEISVVAVLAHELGHAVQFRLGALSGISQATPSIVKEQQADCYAGAYFRWVAEGKSSRFRLSTGPGLNQILATLFFIRDSAGSTFEAKSAHGSAFDRVSAFQFGFGDGAKRCARIDVAEIENRSSQREFNDADQDVGLGKGNLKVDDQEALQQLESSLQQAFASTGAKLPSITTNRVQCPDAEPTSPVSYCPSANQISLNLKDLVKIGTPPGRNRAGGIGDFAAFAEVAARYALGVQRAAGQGIEGRVAAQRTACLTGMWASTLMSGGKALQLSPGDLDEAVGEMLADRSLIAADVNGDSVPAGFARVEAFRDGFSSGRVEVCAERYR